METTYILQSLSNDRKKKTDLLIWTHKKHALSGYQKFCEESPKTNFRLIKRETVEEAIAESEDYRQQKFSF